MNDTLTPERTVEDVRRDLDLDDLLRDAVPPRSCEARAREGAPECGKPASWFSWASCGHDAYYCEACYQQIRRREAEYEREGHAVEWRCPLHPRPFPVVTIEWRSL